MHAAPHLHPRPQLQSDQGHLPEALGGGGKRRGQCRVGTAARTDGRVSGKGTRWSATTHERGGTGSERRPASREEPTRALGTRTGRGYRGFAAAFAAGTAEKVTEHRLRVPASLTDALRNGVARATDRRISEDLSVGRKKKPSYVVGGVVIRARTFALAADSCSRIGWREVRSRRASRRRASAPSVPSAVWTGVENAAFRRAKRRPRNRRHRPLSRPVRPRSLPDSRRRPWTMHSRISRPSPRRRRV